MYFGALAAGSKPNQAKGGGGPEALYPAHGMEMTVAAPGT